MKKQRWRHLYIAVPAAVTFIALLSLYLGWKRYGGGALAEFNGGRVTREDFLKSLTIDAAKYDPMTWKNPLLSKKIKMDILSELIKERLLLAEAARLNINATEAEFRAELDSYKSGYTDQTFEKMLETKGITYKDWAEKKRGKYLIQKLIDKEVVSKIQVADDEIKKYYNDNINEFMHPAQVRARHILVDTLEEAQKIEQELSKGGNFAQIAKDKSISPERWKGGDLGYFSEGTYPRVFDLVCFNLPIGGISQPVKSEYGYHIFKLIDKRPPRKETLDEARNYIVTRIQLEKSKEAFENWYRSIYNSADVTINRNLLERIEVSPNVENKTNK